MSEKKRLIVTFTKNDVSAFSSVDDLPYWTAKPDWFNNCVGYGKTFDEAFQDLKTKILEAHIPFREIS
jgi:predicted RNase H-like HicB family nuclease